MIFELFFNNIVGIVMLLSHLLILIFVLSYVYTKLTKKDLPLFMDKFWNFMKNNSLKLAFIIVTGGIIGSLIYSEIFKIPVCELCWIQRIVIYPQILILSYALYNKSAKIFNYILTLNVAGLLVGGYQYFMQMVSYAGPCPLSGAVSCFGKEVFIFNYITIPLMSVTLMVLVTLLVYINKIHTNKERFTKQNIQRIEESQ
jgi:disulfide bond formation protein DsbB